MNRPIDALREAEAVAKAEYWNHARRCGFAAVWDPFGDDFACPQCERLARLSWDAKNARRDYERRRRQEENPDLLMPWQRPAWDYLGDC